MYGRCAAVCLWRVVGRFSCTTETLKRSHRSSPRSLPRRGSCASPAVFFVSTGFREDHHHVLLAVSASLQFQIMGWRCCPNCWPKFLRTVQQLDLIALVLGHEVNSQILKLGGCCSESTRSLEPHPIPPPLNTLAGMSQVHNAMVMAQHSTPRSALAMDGCHDKRTCPEASIWHVQFPFKLVGTACTTSLWAMVAGLLLSSRQDLNRVSSVLLTVERLGALAVVAFWVMEHLAFWKSFGRHRPREFGGSGRMQIKNGFFNAMLHSLWHRYQLLLCCDLLVNHHPREPSSLHSVLPSSRRWTVS